MLSFSYPRDSAVRSNQTSICVWPPNGNKLMCHPFGVGRRFVRPSQYLSRPARPTRRRSQRQGSLASPCHSLYCLSRPAQISLPTVCLQRAWCMKKPPTGGARALVLLLPQMFAEAFCNSLPLATNRARPAHGRSLPPTAWESSRLVLFGSRIVHAAVNKAQDPLAA